MKLNFNFRESNQSFTPNFGEVHNISDGGYERGYAEGEAVGYENGYTEGETKGIEQGKQAEYDRFWNSVQRNGELTNYTRRFTGKAWNTDTFKPKYHIKPTTAQNMFEHAGAINNEYIKAIDFSKCSVFVTAFMDSGVVELGVIDCTNASAGWSGVFQMFYNCTALKKIEKFIFPKSSMQIDAFGVCRSLEEVTFEGTAYQTIQFQWSTNLSVATMKSLISCLYNHKDKSTEYTYTVKFANESWAALEADSTAPDGGTWRAYVNSLGWNT